MDISFRRKNNPCDSHELCKEQAETLDADLLADSKKRRYEVEFVWRTPRRKPIEGAQMLLDHLSIDGVSNLGWYFEQRTPGIEQEVGMTAEDVDLFKGHAIQNAPQIVE